MLFFFSHLFFFFFSSGTLSLHSVPCQIHFNKEWCSLNFYKSHCEGNHDRLAYAEITAPKLQSTSITKVCFLLVLHVHHGTTGNAVLHLLTPGTCFYHLESCWLPWQEKGTAANWTFLLKVLSWNVNLSLLLPFHEPKQLIRTWMCFRSGGGGNAILPCDQKKRY